MRRLTNKGKHIVNLRNHTHANMIPKPAIVRRIKMLLHTGNTFSIKRDQELQTILYTHQLLYQNLMVTANQKSTIDTHTDMKKQSKHNIKDSHLNHKRREEGKKKDQQKQNPKQLTKWQ